MSQLRWTAITVTYNSAETLQRCWSRPIGDSVDWIVVDNGSNDSSVSTARGLGARVIETGTNLGFARANNIGLDSAQTEYVVFANPDITIDPSSLPVLEGTIDRTCGLVAPRLVFPDGTVQQNSRGLPFLVDKLAHRGLKLPGADLASYLPEIKADTPHHVVWLMGAAVAAKRTTLHDLGGWNQKYFVYYEDHELGLRSWMAGFPVSLEPRATWVHEWARETTSLRLKPWILEIRSAARFYASYPELLSPVRSVARRRHSLASNKFREPLPVELG